MSNRDRRCDRNEYRNDGLKDGKIQFSIDLNLNENEQTSLILVLRDALDKHGVSMLHQEVVRQPMGGYHPESHIGTLIDLYRRVDVALHGSKNWNRDR
jgi:hypothetical protein